MSEILVAAGRAIVDTNLYLVLGTVDDSDRPWVSPVYFAHSEYHDFFWVSRVTARHSDNLERQSEVAIVVFDSSIPINSGQAVYIEGHAQRVDDAERAAALEIYSRRAVSHGGTAWTEADVREEAPFRLYRARASVQYVLDEHDERVPVVL